MSRKCETPLNPLSVQRDETITLPNPQTSRYFPIQSAQWGWECPRCGQINAPWASHCDCRKNYYTITASTTGSITARNGSCPIYTQINNSVTDGKSHPDNGTPNAYTIKGE